MKNLLNIRREWLLLTIIVVIILAVGARAPVFLTWRNGLDIANDSAILAILVMGQMLVLLTRGIDLSAASNLALTGMVCALLGKAFPGVSIVVLIAVALAVGGLLVCHLLSLRWEPCLLTVVPFLSRARERGFRTKIFMTPSRACPVRFGWVCLHWSGLPLLWWH